MFFLEVTNMPNAIISESDNSLPDGNDEQTLYDKPLLTSKPRMNSSTIKSNRLKISVQDSNASSMLHDNQPSSTTFAHAVA